MSVICLVTEESGEAERFFQHVRNRVALKDDYIHNPFDGTVKSYAVEPGVLTVIDLRPIYPPVYLVSVIPLGLGLVFGAWWLYLIAALLLGLGFFWSPLFYYWLCRAGLRKSGYAGRITIILPGKALRLLNGAD